MSFNNGIEVIDKRTAPIKLARLRMLAKLEAEYSPALKPVPKSYPIPIKEGYYLEWWNLGDHHDATISGSCNSANIDNVISKIIAGGKRNMLLVKRLKDNKILMERR